MAAMARTLGDAARAATRLAELGLTSSELRDAVSYGITEASRTTESDAKTASGTLQWLGTVRAVRETKTQDGWRLRDDDNYPMVVSSDNKVGVAVSSGNANVGLVGRNPRTGPKGEATKRVVETNTLMDQQRLGDLGVEATSEDLPEQIWLLLYHRDDTASETRVELSLPTRMEADGSVVSWKERLILEPVGSASPTAQTTEEPGDAIEVKVRRRQRS